MTGSRAVTMELSSASAGAQFGEPVWHCGPLLG